MELLEAVKRCTSIKAKRKLISWNKVAQLMNAESDIQRTEEQWRHLYRKQTDPNYARRSSTKRGDKIINVSMVNLSMEKTNRKGLDQSTPRDILKNELRNLRTIDQLAYAASLDELEVLGHIELLRHDGYEISGSRLDGKLAYVLNKSVETTFHEYNRYYEVNKTFRIGLVSDTHIGSKFWQKSHLDAAYDHMFIMGVTEVFHAGDITDGFYKDRMSETYLYGADEQVDEVVLKYPKREGMINRFILGNHDATHIRNGGTNIGRAISNRRDDMIYLGQDYAKIWLTDKVDLDLIHPGDGTSYALSYQLQKRINNMSGGKKPKILVTGHYHKYFVMFYRNVIAISMPSFQSQSNWMRGKGIESDMGYVVIEGMINEHGDIVQFNHQFFPFFTAKEHDY